MAAFLQALFGPLLSLIDFLTGCFPHLLVVQRNELGVLYPAGGEPRALRPDVYSCPAWLARILLRLPSKRARRLAMLQGVHVYFPVIQEVTKHHTARMVLNVDAIVVETEDEKPFAVGLVLTYRIVDVLAFEVGYFDADESLAELAEGALRKLVLKSTAAELRDHRKGVDDKLANACRAILEEVGVEVISARLTEQAHVGTVAKVFGLNLSTSVGLGG